MIGSTIQAMICGNTFLQDQFNLAQFRAVPALSMHHYSESSPSSISISVSEYSIQIKIRQLRCSPKDFYLDFHIIICEDPLLIPTFLRFPTLTLKAEFSWRILFSNHNIFTPSFPFEFSEEGSPPTVDASEIPNNHRLDVLQARRKYLQSMVDFNYQPQLPD